MGLGMHGCRHTYKCTKTNRYMYDQAARFIVEHKYQEAFFKRTYKNTAPSPVDGKILEAVGNIKDRDYTDTWGEKGIGPPVVALKVHEIVHKIEQDAVAECESNLISCSRDYDIQHGELLHAQTGTDGASCPWQAWRACWALTLGRVYSLYKPTSRCNAMHSVCGRRRTRQQCSLRPLKLAWPRPRTSPTNPGTCCSVLELQSNCA